MNTKRSLVHSHFLANIFQQYHLLPKDLLFVERENNEQKGKKKERNLEKEKSEREEGEDEGLRKKWNEMTIRYHHQPLSIIHTFCSPFLSLTLSFPVSSHS